jgi:hypothetical protein
MEPNQTQGNPDTSNAQAPSTPPMTGLSDPTPAPQANWLDQVPEAYRQSPIVTKYKTPDEFFKGVENLQKLVGQKQIVNGLVPPGENATEDEWNAFMSPLVPESPDKYKLPDLEVAEGIDLKSEKEAFSSLVHKAKLNPKQAEILFKEYVTTINSGFAQEQANTFKSFEEAVNKTFESDPKAGLEAAKRGAKITGLGNKLDEKGLSLHPEVLTLLAKVGELTKEDTIPREKDNSTGESLKEKALRLQNSPEYWTNPTVQREVEEIYKRLHPPG